MHAEQPEHPRGRLAQQPVGPGCHGPHAAERIAAVQGIEGPRRVPQLAGQLSERQIGADGGPGRGNGQGQRQPGARLNQRGGGLLLRGDPLRTDEFGQQLLRIRLGQHVQRQRPAALGGDQAGQLAAAGDERQAMRATGQQRTDLLHVAHVVQQHQHPAIGHDAAVETTWPSRLAGILAGGTSKASRKPRIASAGVPGTPCGSKPRRLT